METPRRRRRARPGWVALALVGASLVEALAPAPRRPEVGRRRLVVRVGAESPFPFADVASPPATEAAPVAEWVQPSASARLAAVDAERRSTEAAIEAARARAVEARLETVGLKATIASLGVNKKASSAELKSRALAQAEKLKAEAFAAKRRASALVRSREADLAEAVRVAKTELADLRIEAAKAQTALSDAERDDKDVLAEAKQQAADAVARVKADVAIATIPQLQVKPVPAAATAAVAGLFIAKALGLDKFDVEGAILAAVLMYVAIPESLD